MTRAAAVVINHDGGDDVPRCLQALGRQTVGVHVVLVDCASTDGSEVFAASPPSGVTGVPLAENVGYTGGANAGLKAVPVEVDAVGFFNPDCFAAPDLVERCLERLDASPEVGAVAPRLERPGGEMLDSCGQRLTPLLLRVQDRGYGQEGAGAYLEGADVLAACGAGMVWRLRALEAVAVAGEVFPGSFFAFWEDLDLGWRACNAGWRVVYEPRAVAVHRRGATADPGRGRLAFRRPPAVAAGIVVNRWCTFARNLHAVDFAARLPLLLLADVAMVTLLALRRPAVLPAILRAMPRVVAATRQRRLLRRRRLADLP